MLMFIIVNAMLFAFVLTNKRILHEIVKTIFLVYLFGGVIYYYSS